MNMLMLVGEVAQGGSTASPFWRDSFTLCLFLAGGILLVAAAYLLYKTPKPLLASYLHKR